MELSNEELAQIQATAESFQAWWNKEAKAKNLTGLSLPEILGIIWVHVRQFWTYEEAMDMVRGSLAIIEKRIDSGQIMLQLGDGTELPYHPAEFYEGREEERTMLIEMSHGEIDWDQAFKDMTEDGNAAA